VLVPIVPHRGHGTEAYIPKFPTRLAMRVLIVEDDRLLADYIRLAMKEDGHAVDVAYTGDEGQTLSVVHDYDVIVLDHALPGRTGLEIVQYVRQQGNSTPILMLTARSEERDIVEALDSGADDYLAKPFVIGELRARIRALGRRRPGTSTSTVSVGGLTLDRLTRTVSADGQPLSLTPKEFSLLEHFMLQPRRIVTRTELLEKVWDLHFDPGSNVVDVHVARLRQKLDTVPSQLVLRTVRGSGFILSER
jgi:two-component system, OmpR family, response regulator